MKNTLKVGIVISIFLKGSLSLAGQPPDIGHFKGLAFSSATDRHALEINGGTLTKCETDPGSHLDIVKCDVNKGSVVVTGGEGNNLNVKLSRVAVLQNKGDKPTRHYYFRGTADLMIGAQPVSTGVSVILNVEEATPKRVRGFIELPAQAAKTSLEAYLVP